MRKRILHLFDDAIIAHSVIDLYKKTSGFSHSFAIISTSNEYSKGASESEGVFLLPNNSKLSKEIRQLAQLFDVIFFEALSFEKAKVLQRICKNKKKFVWVLWGYELYNLVNYYGVLPEKKIKTTIDSIDLKTRLRDFYTFRIVYPKAIQKIDFFIFLLNYDFTLLTQCFPVKGKHISLCYQTIENLFPGRKPFKINSNNILIGNSSTPSNNHDFVFGLLKNADLQSRKLFIPLSYGDQGYREEILREGSVLFGNQFIPLTKFISLEDYSLLLQGCSHVIMAHDRQQSFGTIAMMLVAGAKVFLKKSNPLFDWFTGHNVILYPIDETVVQEIKDPLPLDVAEHNYKILNTLLSEKTTVEKLEHFLSLL